MVRARMPANGSAARLVANRANMVRRRLPTNTRRRTAGFVHNGIITRRVRKHGATKIRAFACPAGSRHQRPTRTTV